MSLTPLMHQNRLKLKVLEGVLEHRRQKRQWEEDRRFEYARSLYGADLIAVETGRPWREQASLGGRWSIWPVHRSDRGLALLPFLTRITDIRPDIGLSLSAEKAIR